MRIPDTPPRLPLSPIDGLRRLRFRLFAARGGWARALARAPRDADSDLALWAWYRLGCYARVAAEASRETSPGATPPRRVEGAIARAASLAACGRGDAAAAAAHAFLAAGRTSSRERARLAEGLAPFAPALALEILGGAGAPELRAALFFAAGEAAAAREAAAEALRRPGAPAEAALLAANAGLLDPLAALNRRLAADGLAPVAADGLPSPRTLRPAAPPPASAQGPLVSVITPAYETADRLEAAVRSLLAQTHAALEVLIVDDASRDATAAIAARLAAADPRVRAFRLTENRGPYAARAAALEAARGAFVTCHDSDDWAHPERIARQLAPLLARPRLVATASSWVRATDSGRFFARQGWPLVRLNPASPLFRREATLGRMGGFDLVRAGADSEFLERMKLVFGLRAVARLPDLLTVGSHRPGSLMTDAEIGATGGAPSPSRLAYWEAWRTWHVGELAAGRLPRLPAAGPRPFPAPPELLSVPAPARPLPAEAGAPAA